MNNIIQKALNNNISEKQILQYLIQNNADQQLLSKLGYNNVINSKVITANIINDIIHGKYNKQIVAGIIALLISNGQLFGYEVQKGDTLWGIAKSFNCNVQSLKQLNPYLSGNNIRPGMNIVVPQEIKLQNEYEINIKNNKQYDMDGNEISMKLKNQDLIGFLKRNNITLKQFRQLNPSIHSEQQMQYGDYFIIKKNQKNTFNLDAAVKALRQVESSNGTNAKDGDNGKAIGDFQLWPIFIQEYHRLGGNKNYQVHIINGIAQKDDVRRDPVKSAQIVKFVLSKLKYKSMEQVIRGYGNVAGWNSKVSDKVLQRYLNAYEKYNS